MSPDTTIILRPPEQLVIETRLTGGYQTIDITRNGLRISDPEMIMEPQFIVDFGEIYLVTSTTASDLGVYDVEPRALGGQTFLGDVRFFVVEPGTLSQFFSNIL